MTWPEFAALADRWERKQRRENYRAGLAPAAILNLLLPRHKRLGPMDFFAGEKSNRGRQTPEEMLQIIASFNTAIGGLDLRKNGDNR
jgi:hypothetical protein